MNVINIIKFIILNLSENLKIVVIDSEISNSIPSFGLRMFQCISPFIFDKRIIIMIDFKIFEIIIMISFKIL